MVIAGWRKNFEVLADAGKRECLNCHHTTRHYLVGERKEIRLYFVPVAKFGSKRHLVCDVCGHTTQVGDSEVGRIMRATLEPTAPRRPDSAEQQEWQEAARIGGQKAMEVLGAKYAWPWTVEDLNAGLRGELSDTFFRSMLENVTAEFGEPDEGARVELRRIAEGMSAGMRTGAALATEVAKVQVAGIQEPRATEMLVSAVCAEMGVGPEEALRLAKKALGD